jgi:CarD family transcriptional regulator
MAAQKTASKAAKSSKAKKAPAKKAVVRAKSSKPKAKVETKKKMSMKSTVAARQKAPTVNSSPAKAPAAKPHSAASTAKPLSAAFAAKTPSTATAAKPLTAKVLSGVAKDKAPAAIPANANAKPGLAKGFIPKLTVAAGGIAGAPGKPGMRPFVAVAPKPMVLNGKEPEFAAGDYVVYPTHGVGRIQGVVTQEIAGTSLKVIVITFEKERMTLRVPVGKATNSGLRRLSSRKDMETALKTLKGRSRIRRMMWSRRAQEYEAKINSGDPVSIAEVVRDLFRNAGQPDQSYSERQIYQAALDRLARELAAVEKIDEMAAAQKLESVLRAA